MEQAKILGAVNPDEYFGFWKRVMKNICHADDFELNKLEFKEGEILWWSFFYHFHESTDEGIVRRDIEFDNVISEEDIAAYTLLPVWLVHLPSSMAEPDVLENATEDWATMLGWVRLNHLPILYQLPLIEDMPEFLGVKADPHALEKYAAGEPIYGITATPNLPQDWIFDDESDKKNS